MRIFFKKSAIYLLESSRVVERVESRERHFPVERDTVERDIFRSRERDIFRSNRDSVPDPR